MRTLNTQLSLFQRSALVLFPNVESVFHPARRFPVRHEKKYVERHCSSGQLLRIKSFVHPFLRVRGDLSAVLGMLDEVCSAFGGPENVTLQKISSVYTVH